MRIALIVLVGLASFPWCGCATAAVMTSPALGCKVPADASKAAALRSRRDAGLEAFGKPLIASRSCMEFAKGVTIDVDEKRLPLSCVRLTGDLDCYWVPDALVDLFPSQKPGAAGQRGGGRRR